MMLSGHNAALTFGIHVDAGGPLPPARIYAHRIRHAAPFGYRLEARHVASYGTMRQHAIRHTARWWLPEARRVRHAAGYELAAVNRHARRQRTPYSLLTGQSLVPVVNTPELIHAGRVLRVEAAELSCDEDSAVWLARVQLASGADYAGIQIGDPVTLALGVETFALVIDGKAASRDTVGDLRAEITAASPLVLFSAPWATPVTLAVETATQARALVESQIGQTDWRLTNWIIPAGRAVFDEAAPLAIARAVVESIGGLIESAPDGTPICRPRHPVSVPHYASATPAHALEDKDVLGVQANIAPRAIYDRVAITNDLDGGQSDRLEYRADENDGTRGTVRAWPEPWRAVLLAHTGDPQISIIDDSTVERDETELAEFIEGQARTDYPVAAIVAVDWQRADLGTVTARGRVLTAALPGYSLLSITYRTRAREWRVAHTGDETVQFVLMEE